MDIDKDGYIDEHDFNNFLKRHVYLDPTKSYDLQEDMKSMSSTSSVTRMSFQQLKTVPHYKITDDKAAKILIKMRKALNVYRYSYKEFFAIIDENKNGFIVVDQFLRNVNKICKLP